MPPKLCIKPCMYVYVLENVLMLHGCSYVAAIVTGVVANAVKASYFQLVACFLTFLLTFKFKVYTVNREMFEVK